jgi:sugar lactone lactonase YvrE
MTRELNRGFVMPLSHVFRSLVVGLSLLALTSCQVTGGMPAASGLAPQATTIQAAIPLRGRILAPERSAQAVLTDVASGATLALLDTVTGSTVATTLSDLDGRFYLSVPGASLTANRTYYLEASKGLAVGSNANRAGSTVARLRTLLAYQSGEWVSLTNAVPGGAITLGTGTTALSLISALRGIGAATLIGSLTPDTQLYTPVGTLASNEYATVLGLVDAALASDRDPVESIGYDATGAGPSTQYGLKPGDLILYDMTSPDPVATGSVVTVNGQNLPDPRSDVQVTVGDMPVTWSVSADRSKLFVSIPPNGCCGWLRIAQGTSTWRGPFVWVSGTTGTWIGRSVIASMDGTATDAGLNYPCQMAFDSTGNLFVVDAYNNTIRKITPAGVVTTVAGSGAQGCVDGPAASAQFYTPVGLAAGPDGSLYVGDQFNHVIRKISPAGVVSTLAGLAATPGSADGTGAAARFNMPYGLALDLTGNLYVADHGNSLIRKVTPAGVVTTVAGSTSGYVDATGAAAKLANAHGLTVDPAGNIYVADTGNCTIRKITPAGVVTTVAGSGVAGEVDGATSSARFTDCTGIRLEPSGNLLVTDRTPGYIRRVNPATGVVTTIIGSGLAGSHDDAARSATINGVFDIAQDARGRIYMAEEWGQRIRVYCP